MRATMYYIYKKCEIDGGYFYIFKMKSSHPSGVRIFLAENNYEGRFMWNTGAKSRKNYFSSLYR
jgi:hypothetical protein